MRPRHSNDIAPSGVLQCQLFARKGPSGSVWTRIAVGSRVGHGLIYQIGNLPQYHSNGLPHDFSDAHISGGYARCHQGAVEIRHVVGVVILWKATIRIGPLLSTYSTGSSTRATIINQNPGVGLLGARMGDDKPINSIFHLHSFIEGSWRPFVLPPDHTAGGGRREMKTPAPATLVGTG